MCDQNGLPPTVCGGLSTLQRAREVCGPPYRGPERCGPPYRGPERCVVHPTEGCVHTSSYVGGHQSLGSL